MASNSTNQSSQGSEGIQQFYLEAQRICDEAQFIIDSLPNVETPAVERSIHQLDAIHNILLQIQDPYSTPADLNTLITYVNQLLHPLEEYLANPPLHPSAHIPRNSSGRPGRPSYQLDLQRALQLHQLGNSWEDIARALGVSRGTIYNHLNDVGIHNTRRTYTEIDDEELDHVIATICQNHPFIGSTIVSGHLEAMHIHLPRLRVQESLRRVDPLGVMIRYAANLHYTLLSTANFFTDGQALFVDVSIVFVVQMRSGILMEMRNFGHGVSMYMDVLMVILDLSSISFAPPTNVRPLF